MTGSNAYETVVARFARAADIDNALGILEWDTETMMPEGAADRRGETLATLSVLRHEVLTDPRLAEALDAAEADDHADPWRAANVREARRRWAHANAVPADLVAASAKAITRCELAWRSARKNDDFPALLPTLKDVLSLQRQIGQAKAGALGTTVYDALLDEYEPGGRSEKIDALFDDLAAFLPDLTEDALSHQAARPAPAVPEGPFPIDAQRELARRLMEAAGFDFNRGRLDVSLHPFCGGADDDVRITTRYDEGNFVKAMMGVLHETGHALYEQGLPAEWSGQPVGTARGMAAHESQSLIIEMQACRTPQFFAFAAPVIRDTLGGNGESLEPGNLHRLLTRVERSLIRVDADEVTYPTHIILRYRLERALLDDQLDLADLPLAWRDGMAELVGITPADDASGCLQDIHWPGGAWGYFPTYSLGAMMAAQLFDAACREDGDILSGLARGDFAPLLGWLRRTIHRHASLLPTDDLLAKATGRPLDTRAFKEHLKRRYLDG